MNLSRTPIFLPSQIWTAAAPLSFPPETPMPQVTMQGLTAPWAPKDQVWQDVGIMVALAMFWKILSVAAILLKTRKVVTFANNKTSSRRGKHSKSSEMEEIEVDV